MGVSMRRGKLTRRGIGSPSDPSESDRPPAPGGLPRLTHRGLGDSQPPKLVTMHGVAPPSESDRPPSMPEGSSKKTLELSVELGRLTQDPLPDFSDLGFESVKTDDVIRDVSENRSQFRTAPGGGKNRLSGGRAVAAAYVSPSTLSPGHGTEPKLGPVEVAEHVLREARSFQTEPSLAKKRASHNPPQTPPVRRLSWSKVWVYAGGGVLLGFAVLIAGQFARSAHGEQSQIALTRPSAEAMPSSTPRGAQQSTGPKPVERPAPGQPVQLANSQTNQKNAEETPVSAPPRQVAQEFGNASTNRPTTGHAARPPQKTKSSSATQSSQTEASGKKRDLWLE